MAGRREERKKRKQRRKQRDRRKVVALANSLYEDGDTAEDLREKVEEALEDTVSDTPKLDRLLAIFEALLPLLLKLFAGM